jgi:uncharacterized integral membrane protein (TIGR00697 family)
MEKKLLQDPKVTAILPHKYLGALGMIWVTILITGAFTSIKTFTIFGWTFAVAALAYPFVYIFADIFTEVYGYRVTRKIVWTGFLCMLIATSIASLYTYIPSDNFKYNDAFNALFRSSPIVAIGFIIAAFSGELTNSLIVAKMKLLTKGKHLHLRLVISTFFGQTVDNTIAFFFAFYFAGWFSLHEILPLITTTVVFCTLDLFQNPQSLLHFTHVPKNTCIK